MARKILITGVTGQVGSIFADYILENTDMSIVGLMRWQEPLNNINHLIPRINKQDRIKLAYADLNDATSLYNVLNSEKPDWISHLAAQSFPKTSFSIPIETLQTNIIGTANLLESVRLLKESDKYDPAIHVCSSSEVYGKAKEGFALTEETKFHAASPYSLSKIATDYLGQYYAEAFGIRTFVTRMGTHSGKRRSDVFFESTVAKQIALIEAGLQEPVIKVGSLESVRTFQDARDAVRAYFLLFCALENKEIPIGDFYNIAGNEAYKLSEVVEILLSMSTVSNISVAESSDRLRPIDANYQMFDNSKIKSVIDWSPEISAIEMFQDLLDHWRSEISKGVFPINR